jgi:hypothetical protein
MTAGSLHRPWRVIEHAESRRQRAAQGQRPADGREFSPRCRKRLLGGPVGRMET